MDGGVPMTTTLGNTPNEQPPPSTPPRNVGGPTVRTGGIKMMCPICHRPLRVGHKHDAKAGK